jgi:hypothetical protein
MPRRWRVMKKLGIFISLVICILLVGCATNESIYTIQPLPTTTNKSIVKTVAPILPIENGDYVVDLDKVKVGSWALFGSIVVNNYQLGIEVNDKIKGYQPIYIVNRCNETLEVKQIGTEPNEITADIPIKKLLNNGDLANVIGIESDLASDNLIVVGYVQNTNSLTITGFTPSAVRKAKIKYRPDSVYQATLNNEKNLNNPLAKYFKLAKERITVSPDGYEPIDYSFNIPEETEVPQEFSVWIYVESSSINLGGMDTNIGYYTPIKVTMN